MSEKLPDIASSADVREIVCRALEEDIGAGDVTSEALVGGRVRARASVVSRGEYVVAGGPVARLAFLACGGSTKVDIRAPDGSAVKPGDTILDIRGNARSILAAERTALNLLQRMTGIATLTRRFVEKAAPHGVAVLDTRKTTPLLRSLEKYAVLCGGGTNHRMGLFDQVLIKDNHRRLWARSAGRDLAKAVRAARRKAPGVTIEVEVESETELKDVLEASPDWVLLDNMSVALLRKCVRIARGRCKLEASGGVTIKTIEGIARAGVDAVSVGALTHSAPAADLSLEFES